MIFDTLRLYHLGQLPTVPVPDWYEEAGRSASTSISTGRRPLDRVLGTAQ